MRTDAGERRAFPRRIDCDDAGRARPAVNPAADHRDYVQQAQPARRRLDID